MARGGTTPPVTAEAGEGLCHALPSDSHLRQANPCECGTVKQLTRDQLHSRKEKAVRFVRDVMGILPLTAGVSASVRHLWYRMAFATSWRAYDHRKERRLNRFHSTYASLRQHLAAIKLAPVGGTTSWNPRRLDGNS